MTVGAAERCCDQLGWHPRMLWGDLYDQTIADDAPHTATAPAGTSTAWRQGCCCLDCREANRAAISRTKATRGSGRPRPAHHPASGSGRRRGAGARKEHVMASDNFTAQVGNLTDDPELRFTQNGTPVANFRLAVNQRIRQDDGTWRDGETNFFRVNAWRDQAENIAESLAKGHRAVVLGRLRTRSWETLEGEKRSVIEIDADEVVPSLRWAIAKPERAERSRNGERGAEQSQFNNPAPF